MPPGPVPAPTDLLELAEKYRALAALRARRDAAGEPDRAREARAALRALAERHPGCLRELDTLGGAEIARRAQAAAAAGAGGPGEPWMTWIWAYHRLMRAALAIKRAVGGGPAPEREQRAALAAEASAAAGWAIDVDFVTAAARPAQGRLGPVVLRRLAALYEVPAAEVSAALFPARRPPPYSLE